MNNDLYIQLYYINIMYVHKQNIGLYVMKKIAYKKNKTNPLV